METLKKHLCIKIAENEARAEVEVAKGECQERQRVLDEMSQQLQERSLEQLMKGSSRIGELVQPGGF